MIIKKKVVKKKISMKKSVKKKIPVKKVVKKKSSRWGMGYATRN